MKWLFAIGAGLTLAGPAHAQVRPQPLGGDPRLQAVDYDPGQIVQLVAAPGYQLMLELSPDEQVQNVALGDSGGWQVSVNQRGDRLFVKTSGADAPTNMTVITSIRAYHFELVPMSGPASDMPYSVTFRYPAPPDDLSAEKGQDDSSATLPANSRYRVSGDRSLRPDAISDDGQHTFISWDRAKRIPAIYAVGASGGEELVNGSMHPDDVFVIDGVVNKLTFRIDKRSATAVRLSRKKAS